MLEAEKVEALCDVRMVLSVTAPGDAPMKETVVVIMLAPELLCVSCRLQSMYDGFAAARTSQDSPQRRVKLMTGCRQRIIPEGLVVLWSLSGNVRPASWIGLQTL